MLTTQFSRNLNSRRRRSCPSREEGTNIFCHDVDSVCSPSLLTFNLHFRFINLSQKQYPMTNGLSPTWKIRHLKQHILPRCLNLPWVALKIVPAGEAIVETVARLRGIGGGIGIAGGGGMGVGDGTGRPPSPITFAPERERPISSIEFGSPVRCRCLRWTVCNQKVARWKGRRGRTFVPQQ